MKYAAEVERGMALLDQAVPGWQERINTDKLHMDYCDFCILGQLYKDYGIGLMKVFPAADDAKKLAMRYGFAVDEPRGGAGWNLLREAWIKALEGGKE